MTDRQTDGRTDGRTDTARQHIQYSIYNFIYAYASRCKNREEAKWCSGPFRAPRTFSIGYVVELRLMWMNAARKTVRQSYVTDVCSLDAILSSCDHQVNLTESCNSTLDSATDLNMLMLPCNFVPLRQNLFPSRQRRNLLSLSRQLIIIVCR